MEEVTTILTARQVLQLSRWEGNEATGDLFCCIYYDSGGVSKPHSDVAGHSVFSGALLEVAHDGYGKIIAVGNFPPTLQK